jgi:hypothetical protein
MSRCGWEKPTALSNCRSIASDLEDSEPEAQRSIHDRFHIEAVLPIKKLLDNWLQKRIQGFARFMWALQNSKKNKVSSPTMDKTKPGESVSHCATTFREF